MSKNLLLFSICLITSYHQLHSTKIAVIGAGYVGLVTSAILSDLGNTVICADIDTSKIDNLNEGILPIYEPGLPDLIHDVFSVKNIVIKSVLQKRLSFSCDIGYAIQESEIVFLAVGTPTNEDGQSNLDAMKAACLTIARNLNNYKVIVIKSTVPIGTYKIVKETIEHNISKECTFDVVSNPEFLRQGSALNDFLIRNPIVIGSSSEKACRIVKNLYQPLIDEQGLALIVTDNITAETIKYCWNSFAAIKISYVNEIANLCQNIGADIFTIIRGMGLNDSLLPLKAIIPGPGYGGSCLPKDTKAFVHNTDSLGIPMNVVKAAMKANQEVKQRTIEKIFTLLEHYCGFHDGHDIVVTLLGLSFKANTDDIRYSVALEIIPQLLSHGIRVQVYDPVANKHVEMLYPDIVYCHSVEQAVKETDLIVIVTDWQEFKDINFQKISQLVRQKIILDTRYLLVRNNAIPDGYIYVN